MISYKDLGLVNTREMFKKAMAGKYAVPAYNFNNTEQIQATFFAASSSICSVGGFTFIICAPSRDAIWAA